MATMHVLPRPDRYAEWFAAQVWAGREQFCAQHLRVRGYEVFLPCYQERHRWSDRVRTIERALFPGYVFCRLRTDLVARVVTSPGVIRIVSSGREPLSVPAAEIQTVQRIIEARLRAEPWESLHQGQRVRVLAGPLRDSEGLLLKVKNRHRLIVSISILHRSVAVEIESDWVGASADRSPVDDDRVL